ncbi:4753_t:CDS:2 [Acaulospora colombiana]|uniref:4753_t:CDS:1 n=1 Tax=Acaulospora colombiana TaxID=27376 RepID=A0ACA9KY61_9GLOM|nr:4753_t:CDS:2 [Acaulospora colombiana]
MWQKKWNPIASTSRTPKEFNSKTSKYPESIEPICEVVNTPPKEKSVIRNLLKLNKVTFAILLLRAQPQKTIELLDEDPDVFITITEKDRLDFIAFWDKMKTDSQMYSYAKEIEDLKKYMEMTVCKKLIKEEIICCSLENKRITSS